MREIKKRGGFDLVDDSKNEMKKFLKSGSVAPSRSFIFAGFIDVEDWWMKIPCQFDDIMTDEEPCLELAESFAEHHLVSMWQKDLKIKVWKNKIGFSHYI